MFLKNSIAVMLFLGSIGQSFAADPAPPWKADVELGIVSTSGNTKNTSTKARAGVVYEQNKWRHTVKFDALNTSNATSTTSERYALSGNSDYKFDERSFAFGRVGYENDRFAGFDYRISEVLGYGYRAINQDDLTLDIEVGPGTRQTQLRNSSSKNELIGYLGGKLLWKFSPTASLSEILTTESGSDTTISRSITALSAQLASSLAMKLTFTARHISVVPALVNRMDTETAVTLVYGF